MILKILSKISLKISKIFRNNRGSKFADGIETITDRFHRSINNVNFDMNTNGEMRVLKIVSSPPPNCIFDVGANVGEWSRIVSTMNQNCTIHAFELVPSTYDIYLNNTKDLNHIIKNNFGLSDKEETISINMGPDSDTATAFKIEGMQGHDEYYKEKILCKVKKAADYVREKNIRSIDFLKIDVEGMDLRVIKGFENELSKYVYYSLNMASLIFLRMTF